MQPGPLRPMCGAVAGVKETFMLRFICNFCFFTGAILPLSCHPFVERLARPFLTHHFPRCERGGEDVGGGRAEGWGWGGQCPCTLLPSSPSRVSQSKALGIRKHSASLCLQWF